MATKFPIDTDQPVIEVTLPVGRHVLELVVEDSAGLRSAPDTIVITVQKAEQVAVAIMPTTASLSPGKQLQFAATVTGSTNTAVTWSVLEHGGGTVSNTGLYTPPETDGTYTVRATSVADTTQRADARVMVKSAAISVSIKPTTASLAVGATQQFSASVTGALNMAVTWSVQERDGGTITKAGLYTAPSSAGTYHVVATSVADTTKSATSTVTVTASICTGATPRILCTSGSPTILECVTGAPTSTCTAATPTIVSTCTGSSPTVVLECVAGAPNNATLTCTSALPTIIRSAPDADVERAAAEKPTVKPKTKK